MSQEKPAWVSRLEERKAAEASGNKVTTTSSKTSSSSGSKSTEQANRPSNMTAEDHAALNAAGQAYNNATTQAERDAAHDAAEAIREKYNYSGGADGSEVKPPSGGSSSGSGSSTPSTYKPLGDWSGDKSQSADVQAQLKYWGDKYNAATTQAEKDYAHAQAEAIRAQYGYSGGIDGSQNIQTQPIPVPEQPNVQAPEQNYTAQVPDFTGLLNQWLETAKKQQEQAADLATQQGVADLERAEQDAQAQFQTQQNQVAKDEAKALDNQALYAEARGDRGGIGQAQYNQIQAQAMQNRQSINTARTKLATDTARAIADLRAQGEFKKADALLQLAQTYLGQLVDLQKWGAEYSLDVTKFNAQLEQWKAEFDASIGEMMGEYQGRPTLGAQKYNDSILADSGAAALAVGIRPSAAQQAAMGYTDAQIDAALALYKLEQAGASTGSGGDQLTGKPVEDEGYKSTYQIMRNMGLETWEEAYDYLAHHLNLAEGKAEKLADSYMNVYADLVPIQYLDTSAANDAAYKELAGDLAELRKAGENAATINLVINNALSAGKITAKQASELRSAYAGNRR